MNVVRPLSFHRILIDAVRDIAERGYVSAEQIEYWLHALRNAAEREMGSEHAVDAALRSALGAIFDRLIGRGRIVDYVPDVARYTLAMVRPKLRAELDRRILAAADLIKLRRKEAIERTLARFRGWSTSIPEGGELMIDKREIRSTITKGLKQYRWEQRRVSIDQGHKLLANIADIVAVDNGAIAAEWNSHWRQPGYKYRPDHKERDERIYAIRGNWALQQGLMTKGVGYTDEMTMPGQEPFCRCYYRYITSLRRLPDSMLTKKGQRWIERGEERAA